MKTIFGRTPSTTLRPMDIWTDSSFRTLFYFKKTYTSSCKIESLSSEKYFSSQPSPSSCLLEKSHCLEKKCGLYSAVVLLFFQRRDPLDSILPLCSLQTNLPLKKGLQVSKFTCLSRWFPHEFAWLGQGGVVDAIEVGAYSWLFLKNMGS